MNQTTPTCDEAAERFAKYPACPIALERCILDVDAWLNDSIPLCEIENPISFGESVGLIVHELKRLKALASAPAPASGGDVASWDRPGVRLSDDADEAYEQVKSFALAGEQIRTRDLQSHFQIGFNRASRFIERMEEEKLISAWDAEIEGRFTLSQSTSAGRVGG